MAGLEQVGDVFDRGGLGVVLFGMPGPARRSARHPRPYARIGFVHEFRPPGAAEVRSALGGRRPLEAPPPEDLPADAAGAAALIRATGGGFRLLHRPPSRIGRILEVDGTGTATREADEAAREAPAIAPAQAEERVAAGGRPRRRPAERTHNRYHLHIFASCNIRPIIGRSPGERQKIIRQE